VFSATSAAFCKIWIGVSTAHRAERHQPSPPNGANSGLAELSVNWRFQDRRPKLLAGETSVASPACATTTRASRSCPPRRLPTKPPSPPSSRGFAASNHGPLRVSFALRGAIGSLDTRPVVACSSRSVAPGNRRGRQIAGGRSLVHRLSLSAGGSSLVLSALRKTDWRPGRVDALPTSVRHGGVVSERCHGATGTPQGRRVLSFCLFSRAVRPFRAAVLVLDAPQSAGRTHLPRTAKGPPACRRGPTTNLAGKIQLNHECTRIDTNETDFGGADPNQPPSGEPGGFSPNLHHHSDIRVHSCPFVVFVCKTRGWRSLVVSKSVKFRVHWRDSRAKRTGPPG